MLAQWQIMLAKNLRNWMAVRRSRINPNTVLLSYCDLIHVMSYTKSFKPKVIQFSLSLPSTHCTVTLTRVLLDLLCSFPFPQDQRLVSPVSPIVLGSQHPLTLADILGLLLDFQINDTLRSSVWPSLDIILLPIPKAYPGFQSKLLSLR